MPKIFTIGRALENDITVNETVASRFHAQLIFDEDGEAYINDINSSNGTFVNGNRIEGGLKLKSTDIVTIGATPIKWRNYLYLNPEDLKDEKNRELTNLTHEETGVVSPNASLEEDPEPAINLEDPPASVAVFFGIGGLFILMGIVFINKDDGATDLDDISFLGRIIVVFGTALLMWGFYQLFKQKSK
ncbi:MAG: FHA domain-containing protein [Chitinophagales bacterium]